MFAVGFLMLLSCGVETDYDKTSEGTKRLSAGGASARSATPDTQARPYTLSAELVDIKNCEGTYEPPLCEKAISHLDRMLESGKGTDRQRASAFAARARILSNSFGQNAEAIQDYEKAIDLYPQSAEFHFNRGNTYLRLNEEERAVSDYNRAIQLDPDGLDIYGSRGWAYHLMGRNDLALRDFTYVLNSRPNDLRALLNRATVLRDLGKRAEAGKDLKNAWRIQPGNPHIRTELVSLGEEAWLETPQEVQLKTSDRLTVYGDLYETDSAAPRPLIVLVHQGDGNARGEYAPIIPRLLSEGFDVLAIDSRLGGGMFEAVNRTVDRNPIRDWKYCDAYPDLVAALDHAKGRKVVVWGSSYSATLALRLAAERPGDVAAVLAFSPASGPAMGDCQPVPYAARVKVPVLVVRPKKELDEPLRRDDFEAFKKQGHETWVADPGAHGSSTLVSDRTGGDVSATWSVVLGFLRKIS
ncbi:MAG TPA: alpha/beta fold hydrolase [Thermoanaerobaculia bacterium]|nr:alpha/beta fold hydrolase [Thermoanaerobaculia bacterium]